jgi:NADH-quinone oxidoreductase subunit A
LDPRLTQSALEPLAAYAVLVVTAIAVLLVLPRLLAPRHRPSPGDAPYESGIVPAGREPQRVPVRFYLVGVLFVIFDLEAVFLFAWAVAVRESGWAGYLEVLVFVGVLGVALFYLWRVGALDLGAGRTSRAPGEGP